MQPYKIAFLGGAFDSAVGRAHRAATELDQRFRLVAGCFSRNKTKNTQSAAAYCVDPHRVYADVNSLLDAEAGTVDAAVVLTPQDQHYVHVTACLDRGIPVICEKALVGSVEDAVLIKSQLATTENFLAVTYNYTGYPMLRELQNMIAGGGLGQVHQILVEMPQEGFARKTTTGDVITPQDWRLRDGCIPTLSLDLGVHLHMLVRFLLDVRPVAVVATQSSKGNFSGIIDTVQCLVKYSNDVHGMIWYTKAALGQRNGLKVRVYGSSGSAEWVQAEPEHLVVCNERGSRFILDRGASGVCVANQARYQRFKAGHPAGFIEAFANYYYDIADALAEHILGKAKSQAKYVFGIEESLEGLKLLDAISCSAKSGHWEQLS